MLQGESHSYVIKRALVALGSNTSPPGQQPADLVTAAMEALQGRGLTLVARSPLFASPCFPKGFGPDFVNAVVQVETGLAPGDLLSLLHEIEAEFGRERRARWGARSLDLDLIACGATILPDAATQRHWADLPPADQVRLAPDQLILPHPRLQDRAFVLIPMARIAPDWRHPVLGKTVSEMLAALPEAEKTAIVPLDQGESAAEALAKPAARA